ncbi:MAG: UDP-N-acetylmuramoyl-L-alanine--D-glutamate ligase [Bauldia litoralis]
MIDVYSLATKRVAVMGLGVAGLMTARALLSSGADVLAWDDNEVSRAKAEAEGIRLTDLADIDWTGVEALILSPGIPDTFPAPHPAAAAARAAGVEIICDVELLARSRPDATYVGITGTNGKSTTTALVAHILQVAGRDIEVGGNLGPPVLGMRPLDADGIYVLELSSYQLERLSSAAFAAAAFLNVSADHLDRHGGLDGYVAAKRRIFANQGPADAAIVGIDDPRSAAVADALEADGNQTVVRITADAPPAGGVGAEGTMLVDALEGGAPAPVVDLAGIASLPGAHNRQNAAAAYAICRHLGVDRERIAEAIVSFPGLAHRQEPVRRLGDVLFVNDSKATNEDAAARALSSYDRIYWIAGGRAKDGGYEALRPFLSRIVHAFLIGEAAGSIAEFLGGAVPSTDCGTLDRAVADAWQRARTDDREGEKVVLLAPACASFDQFPNFAARGNAFTALVTELAADDRRAG